MKLLHNNIEFKRIFKQTAKCLSWSAPFTQFSWDTGKNIEGPLNDIWVFPGRASASKTPSSTLCCEQAQIDQSDVLFSPTQKDMWQELFSRILRDECKEIQPLARKLICQTLMLPQIQFFTWNCIISGISMTEWCADSPLRFPSGNALFPCDWAWTSRTSLFCYFSH